jgi:hypothetical protein
MRFSLSGGALSPVHFIKNIQRGAMALAAREAAAIA